MTPIRLKLVNFRGIFSAHGKTELEIDFSSMVHQDAQLVAFTGPNGIGKTTVLDNMHPYRLMPSHASKKSPDGMTPSGFSFYDHVLPETSALKELEWIDQGRYFKSVIRIRSTKKTQKQECYLMVSDESGNFSPYCGRDGLLSNGSTESYDRCVEEILGPSEVFFTSRFSSQGRQSLASMKVGEIKSLLSQLLRFDRYAEVHAKAKAVCDALKGVLMSLQKTKQGQQASLLEAGAAVQLTAGIEVRQRELVARYEQRAVALVEAERAHAVVQERIQQQARSRLHRSSVTNRLHAAKQHLEKAAEAFDSETRQLAKSFETADRHAQGAWQLARQHADGIKQRVNEAKRLCDRQPALNEGKKKIHALRNRLGQLRLKRDELGFKPEQIKGLRESMEKLRETLSGDIASKRALTEALEAMRKTASIVEEVPCQGTDIAGECRLLAAGMQAAMQLPQEEARCQALDQKCASIKIQGLSEKSRLDVLLQAEESDQRLATEVSYVELEMANLRVVIAEEAQIQSAVDQLPTLQAQHAEAARQLAESGAAAMTQQEEFRQWNASRAQSRAQEIAKASQAVTAIEQELAVLPALVEEDDVNRAEGHVNAVRRELTVLVQQRAEMEAQLRHVESQRERVVELRNAVALTERREQAYADMLALWNLLQLALSKNGILSMELDDAAPAISAHTNALLDECYGGRFTVSLKTQKATAAGILKEDFDILVEDNHRGEEPKSVDVMSGGEKIWINECLVGGISLYMSSLYGKSGGTIFTDETDGPLDETRKRQFMAMKRACLRIGGYDREYVISHTPALWDMCDARIDFTEL